MVIPDAVTVGLLVLSVAAIALSVWLGYQYAALRSQIGVRLAQERELWRERELKPAIKEQIEASRQETQARFRQWRDQELEVVRAQQFEVARREAAVALDEWKKDLEQTIRQDAIQRSQSVTVGKVTEHLVPYLPGFAFNPKDSRFIGSPIDLVVIDGLSNGDGTVREVVFVEIKTGASVLSTRERRVRDAIQAGRVRWLELRPAVDANQASVFSAEPVETPVAA